MQLPRGVSISKASFYQPGSKFSCLDGSATIPWVRVNDDYCDCRDGSDEPGTSACPNGQFQCRDMKYMIISLPSGYVNDNYCDCCDGSDEYENRVSCPSTCSKLAAAAKEAKATRRSQIELGHKLFQEYVVQLKERKEKQRIADEKAAMEEKAADESQPASVPDDETRSTQEPDRQGSKTKYQDVLIDEAPTELENPDDEIPVNHPSDPEEQYEKTVDSHLDDTPIVTEPPLPPVPIDFGPEEGFRMLTELPEQCLEFTNQEYTYMLCPFLNVTQRGRGTPRTTHGTLLGLWSNWIHQGSGQDYEIMYYSQGVKCWNGPDRSAKVFVHCGEKNEITSANEPSRCEYTFDLTTPAACHENPSELMARLHLDDL